MRSAVLLSLGGTVFALITPLASKLLIDDVLPARDVGLMTVLVAGAGAFAAGGALVAAVQTYYMGRLTTDVTTATSVGFVDHLMGLPLGFFTIRQVGEITARISDARGAIATLCSGGIATVTSVIYLIAVPPVLLLISPALTGAAVVLLVAGTVLPLFGARWARHHTRRAAEAGAAASAFQVELLAAIEMVKAEALEGYAEEEARRRLLEAGDRQVIASGVNVVLTLVAGLAKSLGGAVLAWMAWRAILADSLTLGSYVAFTAYMGFLTGPIAQLGSMAGALNLSAVSVLRMFEYLDHEPEARSGSASGAGERPRGHWKGDVECKALTVCYPGGAPVLAGVDLRCVAGEMTAVVGPSGAGKTTLLRAIVRLVPQAAGSCTIGGVDVRRLDLRRLRSQVAFCGQEARLLRGTLRENLTLGRAITTRALEEALALVCMDDFVRELPDGLDTPVGEWGATLSGGQRQRLSLCRTLVRATPIVLLDEPTGQVDAAAEARIFANIARERSGTTVVVVTHREAVLRFAHQVVALARPELSAEGLNDAKAAPWPTHAAGGARWVAPRGLERGRG